MVEWIIDNPLYYIDPLGRPTVTDGSDHCFCTCRLLVRLSIRLSVPTFQNKTNSSKNNDRYCRDCGSGRVDYWWHLSWYFFFPYFLKQKGEALDYHKLALRAVSQKPAEFFLNNRELERNKQANEVHKPGHYSSMAALVGHIKNGEEEGLLWLLVSASFNMHCLRNKGYFSRNYRIAKWHIYMPKYTNLAVQIKFLKNILCLYIFWQKSM